MVRKICGSCSKEFHTAVRKRKYCSKACFGLSCRGRRKNKGMPITHGKIEMIPFCGCWIWTGSYDKDGYGKITIGKKAYRAHRLSYCEYHGIEHESISGYLVLHSCDNPSCVNPNHLKLGTQQENMDEMSARGRSLRGERSRCHILTEDQVKEIRATCVVRSRQFGYAALGKKYGVHLATIHAIVSGRNWRHV